MRRRLTGPRWVAVASTTRRHRCQRATSTTLCGSPQHPSALPTLAAETYTAHSTDGPAIESNEVYPTPCATVPSISIAAASSKRYSLGFMKPTSIARPLLEHWGFSVQDIPPANRERKKEADFLATRAGVRVLVEEKIKAEDPARAAKRDAKHQGGELHAETLAIVRDETVSGVIRDAAAQLLSSSRHPHDFRLLWFTATGPTAEDKYEQFMATLYGRTNILEMNSPHFRRCYFFRNGDFYRRRNAIDGAIAAYINGRSISAKLCLNSLSQRYGLLKASTLMVLFGTAVEDPIQLESEGKAFIVNSDLDRKDEAGLLSYLRHKYGTGPLMKIDLGYTRASVRVE